MKSIKTLKTLLIGLAGFVLGAIDTIQSGLNSLIAVHLRCGYCELLKPYSR